MAFSKSKINRYYDQISCAPPPGKYDPKVETKVKALVFDKGQRFSTPKIERTSSMESLDSCCSSKTPIFRTPSKMAMRRGLATTPRSHAGSRIPLPDKFNPRQITDSDQRLIEEINELTRVHQNQLIEKNEEISTLMEQVNNLNEKMSNLLVTQVTSKNKTDYETEINKLKKELIGLQQDINSRNENYVNKVHDLEENISNHISINKDLEHSLSESTLIYEEINTRINEMAHDFSLQLDKYVESVNKVEDMNRCLFEDYQITMEILKKETDENLSNKQMLMELQESVNTCKDDLAVALKRCKMYEVVQTETSKTINVLSKRLMESEIEVDQLNDVQQDLIQKKNRLEEQVKGLSVENQVIRDSLDTLQQSVKLEVEVMQSQLLEKVEAYRQFAAQESEKQKFYIEEKQNTIDMLLGEIDYYKIRKSEADVQLSSCHAQIAVYQEEISHLKSALEDLEQDFQEKIGAQKALFSQLSDEYEILKNTSLKEKKQLENKVLQLSKDKTSLENDCTEQANRITDLEKDIGEMNHQISQDQSRIKHLESLTTVYNSEVDKVTVQLKESTKIIDHLEKVNIDIKNEKSDLIENLSLKNKEYDVLVKQNETQAHTLTELKKEIKLLESNHQMYTDEIISELVLEKERVSELTNTIQELEAQNKDLADEIIRLNTMISDLKGESLAEIEEEKNNAHLNEETKNILMKKVEEQQETIQLFEYERIAQALSFEEYLEQKDELLKAIERQNREIEALSETADRHYVARRDLEQEICRLTEEKEQLKDSGKEDSMKVTSLEARIADLECRNRELTDIIGPFKDQLVQFEQERNFLLSKSESTEKELKALALESAKALGHQNNKQKIKHVVNLNQNIASLKKELEKCRLENIKLKHELTANKPSTLASTRKNKENKTRVQQKDRNISPSTALKDRNA